MKPYGKANSRALTAAELAHQDLRRQEKKQRVGPPEGELEEELKELIGLKDLQEPPASTAPAKLGYGGDVSSKRKRRPTEAYKQARQSGLQSLGYSQVED